MNQVTVALKPPAAGADIHILQILAAGLPDFFAHLTVRTNCVQGRVASMIFTAEEGVVTDAQLVRLIECVNNLNAPFLLVPSGVETIRSATITKAAPKPKPAPAPKAPEAPPAAPEAPAKEAPAADGDYSGMNKPALIELAKERGVAMYGNKDDIIERLQAADAGGADEANPADVTIEE